MAVSGDAGTPNDPMGMFLFAHGVPDVDSFVEDFKRNSMARPFKSERLRLCCSGPVREDGTKTCLILGTFANGTPKDATMKDALHDFFSKPPYTGTGGLVETGAIISPIEPNLVCSLLWDKWEVDPSSISDSEELMLYVGGHGVLCFDKWFEAFTSVRHDEEFPGAVRTLAGKGETHKDGTETCVFVHIFKKSHESQARALLFGEEKSLIQKEKSVIMPWYPDLFANVKYQLEEE